MKKLVIYSSNSLKPIEVEIERPNPDKISEEAKKKVRGIFKRVVDEANSPKELGPSSLQEKLVKKIYTAHGIDKEKLEKGDEREIAKLIERIEKISEEIDYGEYLINKLFGGIDSYSLLPQSQIYFVKTNSQPTFRRKLFSMLIAAGLIGSAIAGGFYLLGKGKEKTKTSTTHTFTKPPETGLPKIYSISYPKNVTANSYLPIDINASADKVLVQIYSNGIVNNETAVKQANLFHLNLPIKEGNYRIDKIYAFKGENVAVKEVNASFSVFDDPKINSLEIRKDRSSGKIQVILSVSDTSGIENALIEIFGKNKTMTKLADNLYGYNITMGEEPLNATFKVYVFDPFKNSKSLKEQIRWLFEDAFTYWLTKNSLNKKLGLAVYSEYPEKVKDAYGKNREFLKDLLSLGNEMYEIITKEPKALDKLEDSVLATSLAWDLKFTKENATYPTAFAIAEYSVAIKDEKLPMNIEALKLLTNGTQNEIYGKDLVDFEPIILKDNYGNEFVLKSENVPRDVWGIADFLYRHPYVLKHPKTFEAINAMIQQNYWNFFDDPYGPGYYDKKTYKPTDGIVKEIIDKQFEYFWKSTPYAANVTKRWVYLPWYDSEKLKEWFPDKTERKIVLFEFWDIPPYTVDMSNPDENGVWPKVYGINGSKLFVEQLPKIYEIIDDAWKSGDREKYIREWYYSWLIDRGTNGLWNAVSQYVGVDPLTLSNILRKPNGYQKILDINAPDQYLTKNFPPFVKVKFIYGVLRFPHWEKEFGGDFGGEAKMETYGIPLAFKSYGIPIHSKGGKILIGPVRFGISGGDWQVNLPKYVRDQLTQKFGKDKFVFNYGGEFGLHSMKEGIEKDDFKEIHTWYRISKKKLYLWKI